MTADQDVILKVKLPIPVEVKVSYVTNDCIQLEIDRLSIRFTTDKDRRIRMFVPTGV